LSRCGEHPIDVVTSNPYPISSTMELFLLPLCFHSPKWRHLRIDLDSQRLLRMASITGRLQSLASLHIRFIGPVLSDFDCFQFAPQLDTLAFSVDPDIINIEFTDISRLKLPYHQITRYHWYDEECGNATQSQRNNLHSSMFRTLCLLPSLTFCQLSLRLGGSNTVPLQSRWGVSLEDLIELDLSFTHAGARDFPILSYFVEAPSLSKLTLSSSGRGPDSVISSILKNPQRLTYLWIGRVEMPSNKFCFLLNSLTSLKDLSFGVLGGITGDYLSLFGIGNRSTGDCMIVPKLQNLTLLPVAGSESTYSEDALTSILELRRRGAVQPDSRDSTEPPNDGHLVSVVLDRPVKHKRLDSLRAGGLSVSVWKSPA
ncbi:hypothetical protein PQX77_001261, partial [Marasmius sp. AFHP31]